jgi:protein N-terminal asparagine amidohydrolase
MLPKNMWSLNKLFSDNYILTRNSLLRQTKPMQFLKENYLYVAQREFATCNVKQFDYIGSGSATTCNILLFRDPLSGKTSCGHLDGCETQVGGEKCSVTRMINTFTQTEQEYGLDVHLVGGYIDEKKQSLGISLSILEVLLNHSTKFNLETVCILTANTTNDQIGKFYKPIIRGVAMATLTGKLVNAEFLDKGPDFALRGTCGFTGGDELREIFDIEKNMIKIEPCLYESIGHAPTLITFGDEKLLLNTSSSPLVEDENFTTEMRNVLKFMIENPNAKKFFNGKTRYWKRIDGKWEKQ